MRCTSGSILVTAMPLQLTQDEGAIVAATSTSFAGQEQLWLVKLNRTGGINFPDRSNLSGSTYSNKEALSVAVSLAPTEAQVTSKLITSDIKMEVTAAGNQQQAP